MIDANSDSWTRRNDPISASLSRLIPLVVVCLGWVGECVYHLPYTANGVRLGHCVAAASVERPSG